MKDDEHQRTLIDVVEHLIDQADNLIAAIEGITDQFEREVSELSAAASAAEKALRKSGGQT